MDLENKVNFLLECANVLEGDEHVHKLLRSYYLTTCRRLANAGNIDNVKQCFNPKKMCPKCSTPWPAGKLEGVIVTAREPNNSKAKRLIAKLDAANKTQQKGLLTKKQRRRAKWIKKRIAFSQAVTCDFCKYKSVIPLNKPKPLKSKVVEEKLDVVVKTKKKKKKPKDTTAGLKIEKPAKKIKMNLEIQNKAVPATATFNVLTPKPKPKTVNTQPNKTKAQTKIQGNKKNNKQNNKTQAPAIKVQSKTQQKNSILQLAKMLKNQSSKTKNNSVQDRLQSLLK